MMFDFEIIITAHRRHHRTRKSPLNDCLKAGLLLKTVADGDWSPIAPVGGVCVTRYHQIFAE